MAWLGGGHSPRYAPPLRSQVRSRRPPEQLRFASQMGSYSRLSIGAIVFQWKYHVPTFLTFVFKAEDFFIEREAPASEEEPIDPEDLYIEKGGYRTSVAEAKAVLDEYG